MRWTRLVGCTGLAASAVVSASCGGSQSAVFRHSSVTPPATSPVSSPTTTRPSAPTTAPLKVQGTLAIGTSRGLELWTAKGLKHLGPELTDVEVSAIMWSADGRYLTWQTTPTGGKGPARLWFGQVAGNQTWSWAAPKGQSGFGSVLVTDGGTLVFGTKVIRYPAGGGSPSPAMSLPAARHAQAVSPWYDGWVIERASGPGSLTVTRISATGPGAGPRVQLKVPGRNASTPVFSQVTADWGGYLVAAVLSPGTGCAGNSDSQLWSAWLVNNVARNTQPPTAARGVTTRIAAISISGSFVTVGATTYTCKGGRLTSTTPTLWEVSDHRWENPQSGLVAEDMSPRGAVATLAGRLVQSGGTVSAVPTGQVTVDGRTIATDGQALDWSPIPGFVPLHKR